MGGCVGQPRRPAEKELKSVKVGGGEQGLIKWIVLKGCSIPDPESHTGWEMKFNVDSKQNVSGGSKNEEDEAKRKTYTGTFRNEVLDVDEIYEDGAHIRYKGVVIGGILKVRGEVINAGDKGNYQIKDTAEAEGPIHYE